MRTLGRLRPGRFLLPIVGGGSGGSRLLSLPSSHRLLDYDIVLDVELVVHVHNVDLYRAITFAAGLLLPGLLVTFLARRDDPLNLEVLLLCGVVAFAAATALTLGRRLLMLLLRTVSLLMGIDTTCVPADLACATLRFRWCRISVVHCLDLRREVAAIFIRALCRS